MLGNYTCGQGALSSKEELCMLNKINTGIEGGGELRRRERYRCISKAYDTVWQEGL